MDIISLNKNKILVRSVVLLLIAVIFCHDVALAKHYRYFQIEVSKSKLSPRSSFEPEEADSSRRSSIEKWVLNKFSSKKPEKVGDVAKGKYKKGIWRFIIQFAKEYATEEEYKAYSLLFSFLFVPVNIVNWGVKAGLGFVGVVLSVYYMSFIPITICAIVSYLVCSGILVAAVCYFQYRFQKGRYRHLNFSAIKIVQFSPIGSNFLILPLQITWNNIRKSISNKRAPRSQTDDSPQLLLKSV